MLVGAEDGLLAWETDKVRSSVWGERGRGKLVGRERIRNGLSGGTSGAEVSWLEADGVFFFFSVARVGGSASGRVVGVERPGASSSAYRITSRENNIPALVNYIFIYYGLGASPMPSCHFT
jgi:hypothetical protein